jgi:hypothetical protein
MHFPIRRFIMVSHRGSIRWGCVGEFSVAEAREFSTGTVVDRKREDEALTQPIEQASGLRKADRDIMAYGMKREVELETREPGAFPKLGPGARPKPRR